MVYFFSIFLMINQVINPRTKPHNPTNMLSTNNTSQSMLGMGMLAKNMGSKPQTVSTDTIIENVKPKRKVTNAASLTLHLFLKK